MSTNLHLAIFDRIERHLWAVVLCKIWQPCLVGYIQLVDIVKDQGAVTRKENLQNPFL